MSASLACAEKAKTAPLTERRVMLGNAAGESLTQATIRLCLGRRVTVFAQVDEPGDLLRYYFGQAGRRAQFVLDGARLSGRLETRWRNGSRLWFVVTETAVPVASAAETAAG